MAMAATGASEATAKLAERRKTLQDQLRELEAPPSSMLGATDQYDLDAILARIEQDAQELAQLEHTQIQRAIAITEQRTTSGEPEAPVPGVPGL